MPSSVNGRDSNAASSGAGARRAAVAFDAVAVVKTSSGSPLSSTASDGPPHLLE